MEFQWIISRNSGKPYQDFVERYKGHSIVKERIDRNIKHIDVVISKGSFWRALVGCLLTTQQRSGPRSRVAAFLDSGNPVLDFDKCSNARGLQEIVEQTLSKNGLRRTERIAEEIDHAVSWLEQNG